MEVSVALDGRLVACKVAVTTTLDGLVLAADTFIKLDPEGHVESMELKAPRSFTLADRTPLVTRRFGSTTGVAHPSAGSLRLWTATGGTYAVRVRRVDAVLHASVAADRNT